MNMLSNEELLSKGKDCFNQSDYKQARIIFSEIIETDNKNVEAIFFLANIFHLKGEIGKAIKAFSRILEIDPHHTDAAISLSVLYNDIGKYEEAKKIFEQADKRVKGQSKSDKIESDRYVNKQFSAKHFELAELYMTYGRYDEALFEYNKVIALDTDNYTARIKISKVYAKKGFVSKAFLELKQIKSEVPNYIPARVALGVLYYGNGNILEARNEWEKVRSLEPTNSEAAMYLNLADAATETKI